MDDFLTVGIGFSAGGLEAVENFFASMPDKPGAAFVVVQHMPRDYKSKLKYILRKHTTLPILSIQDSINIKSNHIYVLDENQYVKIWDQHLYFVNRPEDTDLNTAIDTFFLSLATDKKEKAVGIIFSGTGSDGSMGVHAIHKAGGKVLVQEPASADFQFMPINAIQEDSPLFIGTPKELAEQIPKLTYVTS